MAAERHQSVSDSIEDPGRVTAGKGRVSCPRLKIRSGHRKRRFKVIVIDRHTVITGSFNFSRNAQKTNDENVLIVVGNRDIAALYIEEFQRLVGTILPRGVGALPAPNPPVSLPPLPLVLLPINTATQGQLESLPGIGPTLAQRIIAGRPYRNMQDLQRVKGIGVRKLAAIQDKIAFE